MKRVRFASPVRPSCEAWNAICSAISHRSMASPTMLASWSSLCSSSLPKYGMYGLMLTASEWVAPLCVRTVMRRCFAPSRGGLYVQGRTRRRRATPGSGPPRCRRWPGGRPPTRPRARTRGAAGARPRPRESPAETSSSMARRKASSSFRLKKTRRNEGRTSAMRNKTPIATVRARVTRLTVGPRRPRAATTTWTSRPDHRDGEQAHPGGGDRRLPAPGHEQADDDVAEQETECDPEGHAVGEEVRRRRKPRCGQVRAARR